MRDTYQVDPECSRAKMEQYANQRFLNPSYHSNRDFEIEAMSDAELLQEWMSLSGLLTQKQAAGLLGMSQPGLNAVINGKSRLSAVGRRFVQHLIADCSAVGTAPETVAEWKKALNRLAEAMEQELPTEYLDNSYMDNPE